jgi:predicted CoA-binding protein
MSYTDPETIERILRETHTWAVVGASANPDRASNDISGVLLDQGYEMIPINPRETEIHGQTVYRDLASAAEAARAAGHPIDVVDIFRRSEEAGVHVDEAIAIDAKAVWLQLGVIDEAAAERADKAGLMVVMDRCPKIELRRLGMR